MYQLRNNFLSPLKIRFTLVFAFATVAMTFAAFSQTPETVIAKAYYVFWHQMDSTDRSSLREESMVLYMGRQSSIYTSHDREIRLEKAKAIMEGNFGENMNTMPAANKNSIYSSKSSIYNYRKDGKWMMNTFLYDNYAYEIEKPQIRWELGNETKSISGWRCQKATGSWKGRDYTVWFCPDLPYSFGPWKLHGLPGLILEAYDSKGEVKFLFKGYENYLLADKTTALPNRKLIMTTEEKFQRTSEAIFKNMLGYMKQRRGLIIPPELEETVKAGSLKLANATIKDGRPVFKGENNPLELTK